MNRQETALALIADLTEKGFTLYDISMIGKDFIKADGCIAILWDIEDVKSHGAEHGFPDITDKQAMEILERVEHGHDASMGISWETIEFYIYEHMEEAGIEAVETGEDEE